MAEEPAGGEVSRGGGETPLKDGEHRLSLTRGRGGCLEGAGCAVAPPRPRVGGTRCSPGNRPVGRSGGWSSSAGFIRRGGAEQGARGGLRVGCSSPLAAPMLTRGSTRFPGPSCMCVCGGCSWVFRSPTFLVGTRLWRGASKLPWSGVTSLLVPTKPFFSEFLGPSSSLVPWVM